MQLQVMFIMKYPQDWFHYLGKVRVRARHVGFIWYSIDFHHGVGLPKAAAYFSIHGKLMAVKIGLAEWEERKTHRIWTWGGARSSNPMSFPFLPL